MASSLFYLLYRRSADVRRLYRYKDVMRWVDHFGLWKFRWSERPDERKDARRGASSGIERWDVRPPDELPGVSPAVVRFLLPITLFGKITDLGYALPPLHDQVQTVEMGEALRKHYEEVDTRLFAEAMAVFTRDRDPGLLTHWFATLRFRPMSAFRDESVAYKGETILELPAVVFDGRAHLPKEQKLAEHVQRNLGQGRKTLVFVEQTGTRDIRARLAEVLREAIPEARVAALSAGDLKPARRELWIRRNAPHLDVLLVNAGLVKTGLDLVMFSDIVFYETNTSLYVVWQSMRRVWRLGQKNAVTTTFLAYDAAMEAALLEVMGEKMKSAMLLYGDNAAGALVDTEGEDDLARATIRRALEGKTITSAGEINGKSLFGSETVTETSVSESPIGTPVAASPALPVLDLPPTKDAVQLGLFGETVPLAGFKTRKRR